MNVSLLEFNFTDFELLHFYNALIKCSRGINVRGIYVCVVFNFAETAHS